MHASRLETKLPCRLRSAGQPDPCMGPVVVMPLCHELQNGLCLVHPA
jgi:hypothetical protein